MFAGGFAAGGVVSPGLIVGGSVLLRFNNPPDADSCGSAARNEGRFVLAGSLGPALEWYPVPHSGFHLSSMIGYASVEEERASDDAQTTTKSTSVGVGAAAGAGYDWAITRRPNGLRIGLQLQLAVLRTFDDSAGHALIAPAMLSTFSYD
jgi:hypothetical protein